MINKIKNLTKIFLKDYYNKLNLINNKEKKINKKNIYTWLVIILIMALTYLSLETITYLNRAGQAILFLKIYLPIIAIVLIFQLSVLICAIFYYSNDIKNIIFLPLKPLEILLAKLCTIIGIMYLMEAMFLAVPIIMYGLLIQTTITYFLFAIIALAIFPILFALIIGTLTMILMKLSKIIKNKELLQIIVITILIFIISIFVKNIFSEVINKNGNITEIIENQNIKIDELNNKLIIINPIIKILTSNHFLEIIINLSKIILINIFALIIFIFIGKKIYLKDVLKITEKINTRKKINKKYKYKKNNKIKSYIKNDIKKIIKNSTFFVQNILQYIFIGIIFALIIKMFLPIFIQQLKIENTIEEIGIEKLKLQSTLISVGIMQIIFTFSNLAISAISREGKNATFMKYIPIPLYTQFKLKALPQIALNTIIIAIILSITYLNFREIPIIYYIIVLITSMLLNFINSYMLLLVDFNKPNLNWTNEESVVKNNGNKLYQYVITIITFLILGYFPKIFAETNFKDAIIIINILLIIFFIILKIIIKKYVKKIYKKIY